MFNLLPFLGGWEYKIRYLPGDNLRRGSTPKLLPVDETGWLINLTLFTTDAYGTATIKWQGSQLDLHEMSASPEAVKQVGALAQDPAGFLQRYYRPNPYSTAGYYVVVAYSGGWQGSAWPYVPTTTLSVKLPSESTQESASVDVTATTMAITNKKLFLATLRAVLGIKGEINPALLAGLPIELEEGKI